MTREQCLTLQQSIYALQAQKNVLLASNAVLSAQITVNTAQMANLDIEIAAKQGAFDASCVPLPP